MPAGSPPRNDPVLGVERLEPAARAASSRTPPGMQWGCDWSRNMSIPSSSHSPRIASIVCSAAGAVTPSPIARLK